MKKIMKIILILFCLISFSYGRSIANEDSMLVAQTVGYAISRQHYVPKKHINIQNIQDKLQSYMKERGFVLKSAFVIQEERIGNNFYVQGTITYGDDTSRLIESKFNAYCSYKNKRAININNIKLEKVGIPRELLFIVPANKIDINRLKNLNFTQAIRDVSQAARKLSDFDASSHYQTTQYKLFAFMMNKLNDNDDIYGVFSNRAFSQKGQFAKKITTKDGWNILTLSTKFTYNGNPPKYFNILWQKDGYLIAQDSYNMQSLIKSIQIALSNQGYDVGMANGKLNNKTKKAIRSYISRSGFYKKSKISSALLWFMQHYDIKNVSKIVQATLLASGINIGKVDGHIGPATIRGVKRYQKKLGLKPDGKIRPMLVKWLIQTSKNMEVYSRLRNYFDRPIYLRAFGNKMWPSAL